MTRRRFGAFDLLGASMMPDETTLSEADKNALIAFLKTIQADAQARKRVLF